MVAATVAERQFVVFDLAGGMYGVAIQAVREIIHYQQPVPVPGAPPAVTGIINLRGVVIGVVDMRRLLNLRADPVSSETRIVVVERDGEFLGMVVDAVTEVVRVGADRMEPPPALIGKQQASGLGGIVRVDKGLLLVLDLQKTLAVEAVRSALGSAAEPSTAAEISPNTPTEPATPTLADLDIDLLEHTFELVKPQATELVDYFYNRLFEAHPGVIPLFANADMQEQRGKLLSAIVLVVTSLRKPDLLVPALHQLGIKHIGYGAEPAHYDAVGAILLESLAHVAGDAWTEEVASAWAGAYTVAANVMRDAAAEHTAQLAA